MIGYVTLGTNNYAQAAQFYDELLNEMDIGRMMEGDTFIAWGSGLGAPSIGIIKPFDGNAASVGNGTMVALAVEKPEQVDALHAKAMALGATNEGDPGPRGEGGFYAGYFRDLDGNKLNFFCMIQAAE